MSSVPTNALPINDAVAKLLNFKHRIILYDGDKHDRALLSLALRNALPNAEVLEASSAVEVAHHVSSGAIDALVADPVARFGEVIAIALDIRKRYPACLCWLFSGEGSLPPLRDCVGRGIDGRFAKTSSGFLELPKSLFSRLDWLSEVKAYLPADSASLFSSIFPGATCLISDDGKLLLVSEEFERLVEQPRFELVGQTFAQFWIDADIREKWHHRMSQRPRSWDIVGRFRCANSEKPAMAITLRMLGTDSTVGKLWAASLTDVSTLAPPTSGGIGSNTNIDELAFTLSHDLQAPLNSLASHSTMLSEALNDAPEDIRVAINEVGDLTTRMQEMLDGIVEYSMTEAASARREIISLDSVLEEAVSNLRSMIDDSGATIEREPLPALAMSRSQMVRVLQNLLSNAIKFRSTRIPRIRIHAIETSEYLQIRFEDNGIGIDAADAEKIFDMFHQVREDEQYPGVGAGLAICRRIIRAHGGEIHVESTSGRGSCFILEFRGAAVRTLTINGGANEAIG